jgi:hypothetical protein
MNRTAGHRARQRSAALILKKRMWPAHKSRARKLIITLGTPGKRKNRGRKMATSNFILLDDQVVTALVSYVDDEGNPAVAPAGVVPAWSAADPDGTLSLAPSADGNSCVIKATGKLTEMQAAQITVTAGSLTGAVQIQVNASAAASISIGLGTPAHQ